MRMKTAVSAVLVMFCVACGWVVINAVRIDKEGQEAQLLPLAAVDNSPAESAQEVQNDSLDTTQTGTNEADQPAIQSAAQALADSIILTAAPAPAATATLGSVYDQIKRTEDPDKYKFKIELTNQGAAVEKVILSEFKARHTPGVSPAADGDQTDAPEDDTNLPLTLLAPLDEPRVTSLANATLRVAPADAKEFGLKGFRLERLNWRLLETDNRNMARFEALLFEMGQDPAAGEGTLRIVKTYRVEPGSYELLTDIAVENLSAEPLKVLMEIQGSTGIGREDVRQDGRKVMVAYKNTELSSQLMLFRDVQVAQRQIVQPSQGFGTFIRNLFGKEQTPQQKLQMQPDKPAPFAWAGITNKYFAAITRPVTEKPGESVIRFGAARYYGPIAKDELKKTVGKVSYVLQTDAQEPIALAAKGQDGAVQQFTLATYLGPKDKEVFEDHPIYKALGYFHTIDFQACCCPASMIAPLAFGIIWLMKSMYTLMGPWGNYGIVIMVLVLVVRLILHPVTKKSQVSMMKMQKLGPRMQEIQKKYANNRAEMNKQVMQLYKEGGATPVMGMLPMFLQMPIWIALWTAVYTSIDLRGAGFLPFWITDLSQPDQLFRIPFAATLQQIPLLGAIVPEYFNLLPILMGVFMYFQQKLMPAPQTAATNPQMAQQQKMMLIMMPLLFPIMLYNGPSGVNLYIMSSIGGGVIEQKVIRKHIRERQEEEEQGKVPTTSKLGGKLKKKKPKPFFRMK